MNNWRRANTRFNDASKETQITYGKVAYHEGRATFLQFMNNSNLKARQLTKTKWFSTFPEFFTLNCK